MQKSSFRFLKHTLKIKNEEVTSARWRTRGPKSSSYQAETINSYTLKKITHGHLWTATKQQKPPWSSKTEDGHIAKNREPITCVTPSSTPENLEARGNSLRGISPPGEKESRPTPVSLTTCGCMWPLPYWSPTFFINADPSRWSYLASPESNHSGDKTVAVVADGPAFWGSSSFYVPKSLRETPHHLIIFGTRAATDLHSTLGSHVLVLNTH